MANISTEDLSNKNLSWPLIRTMDDDIRMLKTNPSLRTVAPLAKSDDVSQNSPISPAPAPNNQTPSKIQAEEKEKAEKLKKEIEAAKEELARKEKERIARIEMEREKEKAEQFSVEKEMEIIRKKDEEFRKQREKDEYARKERARIEQLEIAIKKAEENRAKIEKERAEKTEQFKREKEEQAQREKELEIKRKKDDELKKEREHSEQAMRENEKIEKDKKGKEKAERDRIKKEKEKFAQIEAEKEMEIIRKKDEELLKEKGKAEQIRREKEMMERVKKEEAMRIRKKMSEEIKKEMAEDIRKEKEKAEQVKAEMELEIKKEIEAAEEIKRERESAMKKRVANAIKEEMDAEIEKEKEKAEQIKKEVEMEIKKETEEDIKEEKELEEDIKEEMGIDMRKEIADQVKKEKEANIKAGDDIKTPKTNPSLRTVAPLAKSDDVSQNSPISPAPAPNNQTPSKIQAEEKEKAEKLKKEKEMEMIRKKDEELRKEKEKAEQIRKEKERLEQIAREKNLAEEKSAEREKEQMSKPALNSVFANESDSQPPDNISKAPLFSNVKSPETVFKKNIKPPTAFALKKNLSSFLAAPPSEFKTDSRKSIKNQYLELSGDYEHLSPEMRLARQGFSSFSADLKEGIRKDAELMDQDLVLKKKTAASNAFLSLEQPKNIPMKESLAKQSAPRESSSVFKTVLKIAISLLLIAGVFYGIYYLVFRKAPADIIIPAASQSVLSGLRQIEISADFNFNAAPTIKEYIKNNAASAAGVSRIIIKDTASNNLLKINDLEKALGVIIPANFLDNLTGDYDLIAFNYPQNNYLRMGLALKVKNADLAVALAKEWEQAMFIDLNPLFFDASGFYDNSKSFGENNYKNISIKYLPLGENNLALNYAVDKNKNIFLFAASKEDIYYLIDEVAE